MSKVNVYSQKDSLNIHSPHKASVYSAVIPGLGQTYNKKYWKVPIIYGGAFFLVKSVNLNTKYKSLYEGLHRSKVLGEPITDIRYSNFSADQLKDQKDYYKRNLDLSYIGLGLLYIINILDATIDAHFFTYDVSDDLSMSFNVSAYESEIINVPMLKIKLSFH